jgi:hypothetical protein
MKLKLVDNEPKYYEFIRLTRIHPENIGGFINQSNITEKEQIEYMEKNQNFFHICLMDEIPVGFVGVIDDDIRVATLPKYKKMGVGKFMITEIMKKFPNAYAKIKIDNDASKELFNSCGFNVKYIIMER